MYRFLTEHIHFPKKYSAFATKKTCKFAVASFLISPQYKFCFECKYYLLLTTVLREIAHARVGFVARNLTVIATWWILLLLSLKKTAAKGCIPDSGMFISQKSKYKFKHRTQLCIIFTHEPINSFPPLLFNCTRMFTSQTTPQILLKRTIHSYTTPTTTNTH